MKGNVWKNYIYNTAYQILVLILPLITAPYVSRVLGAEMIGVNSYTNSTVSYFVLFATLGTNIYGIREVAYYQDNAKMRTQKFLEIQLLKLITTTITLAGYGVFVAVQNTYQDIYLLQGVLLVANFFEISWFFQGMENFRLTVTKNLVIRVLGIAAILLLVKKPDDITIYIAIQVVSNLIGGLSLWVSLPKVLTKPDWKAVRPFAGIKTVLELFLPTVAVQVYAVLDKTMLGTIALGSMGESGYYEQASRIVAMGMALVTSLGTTIAPRMAAEFAKGNIKEIKQSVTSAYDFVLLLACPVWIGLASISDVFVPWFFGEEYQPVVLLLKMKSILLMIIPLSNLAANAVLNPTKQHKKGTFAVVVSAIINFALNCFLIPRYMAAGAVVATVAAEVTVTVLHFYFIREYVSLKDVAFMFVKYLFASMIMGVMVLMLGNVFLTMGVPAVLTTVLQVVAGMIAYLVITLFVVRSRTLVQIMDAFRAKIKKDNETRKYIL